MSNIDNLFKDFRKFYQSRYPQKMSAFDDIISKQGNEVPEFLEKYKNYINPQIIEEREMHATTMDVFSRLMMDRQIYFGHEVTPETCNIVIAQLLYLKSVSSEPIVMYLNSPGGSVVDGFGLIDTMGMLITDKIDITTIGTGMAASMGSLLISSGTRGQRKALENTWVMLHELSSGFKGKFSDIVKEAEFCKRLTTKLYNHLAQRTGKTYDEIKEACENGDNWLSAEEAKDFGLIDEVIYPSWD